MAGAFKAGPRPVDAASPSSMDEADLVKLATNGDRQAFREIVERYQKRLFSLVFSLVRNTQDAQDITQETFVKAYLSLKNFRGDASLYTWLYRIAYNMSVDFKRRKNARGGDIAEFDESRSIGDSAALVGGASSERGDSPLDALYRKEQAASISQALKMLSEEHRTVITLREIDGLSYEEISRVTGVGLGTVMSRLHYARKKLQEALKDLQ